MKIDWKFVSGTPGYLSLKAAFMKDRKCDRDLKTFKWVIAQATHYAEYEKIPLDFVLNDWELRRTYNWRSYYKDCNFPKYHSKALKMMLSKGLRKYYKEKTSYTRAARNTNIARHLEHMKSNRQKPRWKMARKKRAAKIRDILNL